MKKDESSAPDEKTDLKHDTMEFSANTAGDDVLDTDKMAEDEDAISSEELDLLEDDPDAEAAALNAVESDLTVDDDILPEEDWTDDLPGEDAEEEKDFPRS